MKHYRVYGSDNKPRGGEFCEFVHATAWARMHLAEGTWRVVECDRYGNRMSDNMKAPW